MPPALSFFPRGTMLGDTSTDPGLGLVEELLGRLERPPTARPARSNVGATILGALGDALLTAGKIRAGQAAPAIGPFTASLLEKRRSDEAEELAAESEMRSLRNQIRVREFERGREEQQRLRLPPGVDTATRQTTITDEMIQRFGLPASSLGEFSTVRDRIDHATGRTIGVEYLGPAEPKAPSQQEFETIITSEMAQRFGLPAGSVGQFSRVRDTIELRTGVTTKREILGPAAETTQPIVTTEGIFPRGAQTGRIGEVLRHPRTGEPLKPFQEEMLALRQQVEELNRKKAFRLPPGMQKDLTESGVAAGAAETALRRYIDLGSPDLGFLFQRTPDRFASAESLSAQRAISEAVVPVKKFFLGGAVPEQEASAAKPLIVILGEAVAPNVLKESLLGLINIGRRARQRILLDARANGLDISGFESELTSGELTPVDTIEEFLQGVRRRKFSDRVTVDDQGNMKVEE